MKKILGLDLGTNSIGWSLICEDKNGVPLNLIDCGTRIFIKAVEEKTPTPKNHKRRQARMARRLIQRRARRRQRLQNYLIKLGFLPSEVKDIAEREKVLNNLGDAYSLRAKALDQELKPFELGRALLHLVSRRGFQSNRKTLFSDMLDDPDVQELLAEMEAEEVEGNAVDEKEEGDFKKSINELQQSINAANCRTLGEYLSKLPINQRKRNRRTGREMYKHEVGAIFAKQSSFHPLLTDAVQQEIEHIIFFQRPLRTPTDTIGYCSLERKSRRAHMARLEFQRFRYLQDINHLRYDYEQVDTKTGEILGLDTPINDDDKNKLINLLEHQRTLNWSSLKKALGLPKNVLFNLEEVSKTKGLVGNQTACAIRAVIGEKWDSYSADQQRVLVEDLLSFEKKSALKMRLISHWRFDSRTAVHLVTLNLPDGYANLSLKALRKLLPFMEQGLRYDQARVAAGYTYQIEESELKERLPLPPSIRNPIVQKALFEVRRVVNAVIAVYGKPDAIRIELPRELTMNKAQKAKHLKQQSENTKANDRADKCYQQVREQNPHLKLPERSAKDDRLKYRLWEEQKHLCLYTGKQISMTELFSGAVEVDHILPYKRTVNDSYMNKVVVMATANREKGNRTPYEAYSSNAARYEQIVQRAGCLPLPKRKAVLQTELGSIEDFINSQLTDTAYISREVKNYVACLGCDVSVTKGIITARLRREWGLNTVLGGEVKNREDHRHHAIDAIVTALTSRRLYHAIVHVAEQQKDIHIDEPWPKFREELIEKLSSIIVSHSPVRKLVGAFHEETGYGVQDNDTGGKRVVYRKILDEKFDVKQITKIVDLHLQEKLRSHLAQFNNDPKQAFNDSNRPSYGASQAPLRHVRIVSADNFNERSYLVIKDASGKPYRYHPFGNNHHVEIIRNREKGKVIGKFVNTWEAANRVRRDRSSLIQTDHGADWEFLMALCISDTVSLNVDGLVKYFRVQSLDPDGGRIVLREHTAATLENDNQKIRKSVAGLINEMNMTLVRVSPLGHVRHDKTNN